MSPSLSYVLDVHGCPIRGKNREFATPPPEKLYELIV